MNKLISTLFVAALTINTFYAIAATTPENADDASSLGTSASPQHNQQENRTEKGATDVNQGATSSDASSLGNVDSP